MSGDERVLPPGPDAVAATTVNTSPVPPEEGKWQKRIKTAAPWIQATSQLATVIALVLLFFTFDLNTDVADRVWSSQLVGTIYNSRDCQNLPCDLIASLQAREEAVKAYIALEREYGRRPKLRDVDLIGAVFPDQDFNNVDLPGAKLVNATLEGAQFINANLQEADLSGARLTGSDTNLDGADLSAATVYADLQGAILTDVNFKEARLGICDDFDHASGVGYKSANLKGAKLANADFDGTFLCGVDITDTDLREVQHLSQEQLDRANGNSGTEIPSGLSRPKEWSKEDEDP